MENRLNCPVCGRPLSSSVCSCGYDRSMDYEQFRSLQSAPRGQASAGFRRTMMLKRQYEDMQRLQAMQAELERQERELNEKKARLAAEAAAQAQAEAAAQARAQEKARQEAAAREQAQEKARQEAAARDQALEKARQEAAARAQRQAEVDRREQQKREDWSRQRAQQGSQSAAAQQGSQTGASSQYVYNQPMQQGSQSAAAPQSSQPAASAQQTLAGKKKSGTGRLIAIAAICVCVVLVVCASLANLRRSSGTGTSGSGTQGTVAASAASAASGETTDPATEDIAAALANPATDADAAALAGAADHTETVSNPNGSYVEQYYDSADVLQSEAAYSPYGRLTSTTVYEYSASGELTGDTTTNADGSSSTSTYSGGLKTATSFCNVWGVASGSSVFEYSGDQLVSSTRTFNNQEYIVSTYNDQGQVITEVSCYKDGTTEYTTTSAYCAAGYLTGEVTRYPDGHSRTKTYDEHGNETSWLYCEESGKAVNLCLYTYDDSGNQIREEAYYSGVLQSTTTNTFDSNGRMTTSSKHYATLNTWNSDSETEYTWSDSGVQLGYKTTCADGTWSEYTNAASGYGTKVYYADGTLKSEYSSEKTSDGLYTASYTSFDYDHDGTETWRFETTYSDGIQAEEKTYSYGALSTVYEYDGRGLLATDTEYGDDGAVETVTTYTYDAAGVPLTAAAEDQTDASQSFTRTYAYNADGTRSGYTEVYQDGTRTVYTEDIQTETEQDYNASGAVTQCTTRTYDGDGKQLSYESASYDDSGAVTWRYVNTYNDLGQIEKTENYNADGLSSTTINVYDAVTGLVTTSTRTSAQGSVTVERYTYDDRGRELTDDTDRDGVQTSSIEYSYASDDSCTITRKGYDADGSVTYTSVTEQNADSNDISEVTTYSSGNKEETTWDYASDGTVTRTVKDYDADQSLTSTEVIVRSRSYKMISDVTTYADGTREEDVLENGVYTGETRRYDASGKEITD